MELNVGDCVRMKKPHPCGGDVFTLLRVGADLRLECRTCGRQVLLPRREVEKRIKEIVQNAEKPSP